MVTQRLCLVGDFGPTVRGVEARGAGSKAGGKPARGPRRAAEFWNAASPPQRFFTSPGASVRLENQLGHMEATSSWERYISTQCQGQKHPGESLVYLGAVQAI